MAAQKILITGMGVVSAAGMTIPETLTGFAAGIRNLGQTSVSLSPLNLPVFEVVSPLRGSTRASSRTLQLAFHALDEALSNAGLSYDLSGLRVGVCMGTTVASQLNDMDFYTAYRKSGKAPLAPVETFLKSNLATAISREVKARGPCITVVNACSSSADALGVALGWLRNGFCDVAIAGGADELSRIPVCGFSSLSVFSPEPCRPYDRDRQGLNLGEAAGILILEPESIARRRGVNSTMFVGGYGAACDAHHLTAPRPDGSGLETAIRISLIEAGVQSAEISFVNAHGTATRDNDKVEGTVLARLFGEGIKVISTKGFTGHTLGAAGAIEAVFTALALREGWIPASPGFENKDDEIPIGAVREKSGLTGRYALSTSLAFGGNNAAVVIGRTE
ncbi:MAG: beta-ketoacyl-[acyl-carrier-protein] synthase family protein [bacterium]